MNGFDEHIIIDNKYDIIQFEYIQVYTSYMIGGEEWSILPDRYPTGNSSSARIQK